jgi:hypothetical protein
VGHRRLGAPLRCRRRPRCHRLRTQRTRSPPSDLAAPRSCSSTTSPSTSAPGACWPGSLPLTSTGRRRALGSTGHAGRAPREHRGRRHPARRPGPLHPRPARARVNGRHRQIAGGASPAACRTAASTTGCRPPTPRPDLRPLSPTGNGRRAGSSTPSQHHEIHASEQTVQAAEVVPRPPGLRCWLTPP